jgi:uncharacterized membrane protein
VRLARQTRPPVVATADESHPLPARLPSVRGGDLARAGLVRLTADRATLAAFGVALAAACGLALTSIYRHDRFASNAYDLGIYDQSMWGLSHFEVLIPNTVQRLPSLIVELPLMFTLAPLYWLWEDARMLLVAQAALLALASLPIFWWARHVLGTLPAFLFQLAYLSFFGVLSGNLYDFHPAAVAAPLISFALFGLVTGRTRLLLAMLGLLLLTKENYALTVMAIGLYVAVVHRRFRLGLPVVAVAAVWFVIVWQVILPAIVGGGGYKAWEYDALGSGPADALVHLVRHPIDSIELFFTPHAKRVGLFNLFAPWLFLPLLSPLLLVGLPTLAERFFGGKPALWAQGFHYSLPVAPVLAFAAIDATRRIAARVPARGRVLAALAGACVLAAGLYFTLGRLRPLDELERYATDRQVADIRSCLAAIPPDASVVATSALVPHLSHRRRIYVLDERPVPRTQYVAVDLATWHFPRSAVELGRVVERSLRGGFGVACSRGAIAVLERGAPSRRLSPQLAAIWRR